MHSVLSIITFQSDAEAYTLSASYTASVTLDLSPSLCVLDLSCGWQTKSYSHPDISHKANAPRKYCKTEIFKTENSAGQLQTEVVCRQSTAH